MLLDWPLVGRGDELARIEQLLAGPPAGVALAGGAGVGKTRLAAEVLDRARRAGRTTAWVQATGSARSIPFGAFAHLLPSELSGVELVNLIRRAGDAVVGRSEHSPLVLGVDDAHLLDAASSALVRHLGQSDDCFVVLTVRRGEPVPDGIVSLWKDGPLHWIELRSLTAEDAAELVPAVLGGQVDGATLHQLWKTSDGNALFLHELVLDGVESGTLRDLHGVWRWSGVSPSSQRLTELVDARLGELSPAERAVLDIVAQAEPLEAAFLDHLTDATDRAALERRRLLDTLVSGRRRMVRLSHPLYAESLRANTPPSSTRLIWRQLSDLLHRAGARRAGDLLRLATWRLGAGDVIEPTTSVAAARLALGLQDFALAERLARSALQACDLFEAHLALANSLIGLGRGLEAEALLAELERAATDDESRAQAALRRSDNLYGFLGDGDAARRVLDDARLAVTASAWRETLLAASARLELFGGDARIAVSMVGDVLERRELGPDLLVEVWPLGAWGRILTGRPLAALEFCDRLAPLAEQRADRQHGALAPDLLSHNRCAAAMLAGRMREADSWSRDTYQQSLRSRLDVSRGVDAFTHGWMLRVIGRLRPAVEVLREGAVALREHDLYRHRSACLGELAHCHALLGEVAAAEAAQAEADASRVPALVMDHSFVEGARAQLAYARGEHARARQLARECAERCSELGHIALAAFAWHDLARLGDPVSAAGPLESLVTEAEGVLIATFANHAAALAARDAVALDRVAAAFEDMGAALYGAEAAGAAATRFRELGRTGSALTSAATAHRLVLGCAGARTPAVLSLDASLPLTSREREVATLAALGKTNRQIAEQLVVSVRTVDNHLHNAYSKLGVTHRQALAAILLPGPPSA